MGGGGENIAQTDSILAIYFPDWVMLKVAVEIRCQD